jgi:hypothetical protein
MKWHNSMCPTAEDSGMLMSSVVINVHMCWQDGGKRGQWGLIKGTKNEAVDFEHGASKTESSQLRTNSHHFK